MCFLGYMFQPYEIYDMIRNVIPPKTNKIQSKVPMRNFTPRERKSMSHAEVPAKKRKNVTQHQRNQSQFGTCPKTVVGFHGLQQRLVGVGNSCYRQIYRVYKISSFYVPKYLLHSGIFRMSILLSLF